MDRNVVFVLLIVAPLTCIAHSGGTDEHGCHAGTEPYHCHNEGSDGAYNGSVDSDAVVGAVAVVAVGWAIWYYYIKERGPSYAVGDLSEPGDSALSPTLYLDPNDSYGGVRLGLEYRF